MKIRLFRYCSVFLNVFPMCVRKAIFRFFGMKIGKNTRILPYTYFETPHLITFGNNTFCNRDCRFHNGLHSSITVDDNVHISYGVKFLGTTHEIGPETCRAGKEIYQSIHVKQGTWIGAGVTIFPGVTIERGCIIGAGAVVLRDCQPNTVYAGVPAKPIRKL